MRIQRDQRATAIAESLERQRLQPRIQFEHQIGTRGGRRTREQTYRASGRIDFHLLYPRGAVQRALVALLEAHFSDVIGTAIVGKFAIFVEPVEFFLINASDVADHVRKQFALGVLTEQARLDLNPRKAIAMHREARNFLVRKARAYGQALEALALFEQLAEAAAVARRYLDDFAQAVYRGVHIPRLAGRDFQGVRGVVVGQLNAVAISNHTAARRRRHHGNAIGLRQRVVVITLHHLQIHEACQQQGKHQQHKKSQYRQPDLELLLFALRITKLHTGAEQQFRHDPDRRAAVAAA